jgi:hypothetical protein
MIKSFKSLIGILLLFSITFGNSSCNFLSKEAESTSTDSKSEITQTEADLERGREAIMEQRAIEESLPPEETSIESSSLEQTEPERRMINWYCAWCCKIIQKSDKPDGGSCNGSYKNTSYAGKSQRTSHGGHSWYELSIVGNRKFECSHCHVIIDSDNKPDNYKGVCDGYDDKLDKHYWNEL